MKTLFTILCVLFVATAVSGENIVLCNQYTDKKLTMEQMVSITSSKLPDRVELDSLDQIVLFKTLDTLGIRTEKDLYDLFTDYLEETLEMDKRICEGILKNYEERKVLMSDGYAADEDEIDNIRQGRFFAQAGVIRQMLEFKYGDIPVIRHSLSEYMDEDIPEEEPIE